MKIYYPEFSREQLLSLLEERAKELAQELPLVYVALFGSYATNRQTAASDIDLLVVYEDPKTENDYSIVWDAFNLTMLEPHVYTVSQYANLYRDGSSLLREISKTHLLVFGQVPHS